MPYYVDAENKLHWIEGEAFEHLLPVGSAKITDEEASSVLTTMEVLAHESRRSVDAIAKLREIDIDSIRLLREYVAAQTDAPQAIKDKEAEAVAERSKLK
jgi:hypothetical protein